MALENEGPGYWLLFHATGGRQYAGNEGYADTLGSLYLYDSTVPNHKNVKAGDHVALWNNDDGLLGISTIENIRSYDSEKNRMRCPSCASADIKARKTKSPKHRCHDCTREFNEPITERVSITAFEAAYEAKWTSLAGAISPDEVKDVAKSRPTQHAIRPMKPRAFELALRRKGFNAEADHVRTAWEIG